MNKIAVLLTCFNRKETTLRCLNNLFQINKDIDVYLVDDNSSDGTCDAIRFSFPQVKMIKGDGNLFWSRGMRLAWQYASKYNYDFYIWLNDDVVLYKDAFKEVLECSESKKNKAIIAGIIETKDKTRVIYGGYSEDKKPIIPNNKMMPIKFMNGNFVLIPKYVHEKIGNFDIRYHHDLGDIDYGLRAINQGLHIYSTKRTVGSGEVNEICRVRLNNSNIIDRFRRLYSPLGSNPNITFYFRKKYFGYNKALIYLVFIVFLNCLPDNMNNFLFGNKYK